MKHDDYEEEERKEHRGMKKIKRGMDELEDAEKHEYKKGGHVKHMRGGGIDQMVMKKVGRNLAKVENQRSGNKK